MFFFIVGTTTAALNSFILSNRLPPPPPPPQPPQAINAHLFPGTFPTGRYDGARLRYDRRDLPLQLRLQ